MCGDPGTDNIEDNLFLFLPCSVPIFEVVMEFDLFILKTQVISIGRI